MNAINRACDGVDGLTALHICFGYAHVHDGASRPEEYDFLAELSGSAIDIVLIEAAQPRLHPSVLRDLPNKRIMYGVIDLNDPQVEAVEMVAARIREALQHSSPEQLIIAPDCGMKYLPHEIAPAKMKAMVAGAAIVRAEVGGASQSQGIRV